MSMFSGAPMMRALKSLVGKKPTGPMKDPNAAPAEGMDEHLKKRGRASSLIGRAFTSGTVSASSTLLK